MFNLLSAFFKANLGSEPRDIWKVEDQMLTVNTEMMDNLSDDEFYGLMTSSQGLSNAYKGVFASLATDTPGAQKMPDRENAAYHRLADLLTVSKFRPKPASFNKKETYLPEEFVLRGANTAAISTWTLLLSVVLEYNQEYGAPMTPEVLDSVTSDVRKILTQVASLQIFDFGDFDDFRIAKTGEKKQPGFSWQSVIVMTGPAAAPRIRLNAEFLESFEDYIGERDYEEFQHGCPAIIAEGEDGNMITDFVNFYEGLAKRALLPHQERFVTLAQKI
jgi:hypothetical protein